MGPWSRVVAGCLLVLSLVWSPLATPASDRSSVTVIHLRSGQVHGPVDNAGLPSWRRLAAGELAKGGPALLLFDRPIDDDIVRAARAAGIQLSAYLGPDAVVAHIPEGGLQKARDLPNLAWAAPYHPGLRVAPSLARLMRDDAPESVPVTIHLFSHADAAAVATRLRDLGLKVSGVQQGRLNHDEHSHRPGRIVVHLRPADWSRLEDVITRWPETFWIDRRPVYRLANDDSAWVGQAGLQQGQATPVYDNGLYGDGQVIGLLDSGIDADMCFFRDDARGLPPTQEGFGVGTPDPLQRKVIIVDFLWSAEDPADPNDWDTLYHGTHVAGSAAGDNLATPGLRDPADGMAPAAKLIMQDGGFGVDACADLPAIGCPAADLYPFFEQAYLQGARIHSNSYGDREDFTPYNIYSDGSEAADAFMWDHPDFLLVFAAGNRSGAETILSPATAKNVLAVGATNRGALADTLLSYSSTGPAHDGRIKPDVTVPGTNVVSAANDYAIGTNNCGSWVLSGTSMATATAAGLAALVREYYTKGFYPTGVATAVDALTPSAALLKASLIVSAAPMENVSNPVPSNGQGWGRLLLDDVLYFPGDTRRLFTADVASRFPSPTGPQDSYSLNVLDGSEPLRVVLAWTDYPSNPAAVTNLVNDLNLEVESPTGTIFLGNVFSGGVSQTGGSADSVNNVEAVRIENPEPGVWEVRVAPQAIPQPSQGYALVATGRIPAKGILLENSAFTVDDTVGGNGDGAVEPGEWVDLPLTLLNSGDMQAGNVLVQLETLTPSVEIIQASSPLSDLATGQQDATAAPHLRLRVGAGHPCAGPIALRFHYLADGYARTEDVTLSTGTEQVFLRDDLEGATGWQHVTAESTATTGDWVVGDPIGTGFQPDDDASPDPGSLCLYTAPNTGGADVDDVDNGVVVARSGAYDLAGHPEARLRLSRWYANRDLGKDSGDYFRLEIRESPTSADLLLEELDHNQSAPGWSVVDFRVADFVTPGPTVELAVSAADGAAASNIIEAAIDEIVFWDPSCQVYDPVPNVIDTLAVNLAGNDVVLSWDRPGLDPSHGETSLYRIYSSLMPTGGYALLEEMTDPSLYMSHIDPGAVSSPTLFYQVISANGSGGSELLP